MIQRNSVLCLICHTEIVSRHRHDYATCECGQVSVDGGRDYIKRGYQGTFWIDTSETVDEQ